MPKNQLERLWLIGAGIVGFAIVLIGYFFFISPQRDTTSQVDSQVSSARTQNDVLQTKISHLAAENKKLATYQATLAQARQALPSTSGLPSFLRTLQAIGSATGSDVSSLSVGDPVSVTPATATSTAPVSTASGNAEALADPGADAAVAAPAASSGVYSLSIAATVTGSQKALGAFLDQLQNVQPRAVLISQITQSMGASSAGSPAVTATSGTSSLQISMMAFVAPATTTLNPAAPGAGTPSPAATPAGTP